MNKIKVTPKGIEKLLNTSNLNVTKTMGPDSLHPRVIKEISPAVSEVLAYIFQQSIDSGSVPEDWKMANICPICKKNDKSLPSNYRPVSLTCICWKLIEHIICPYLMTHFETNNILNNRQHAFRKAYSCETQLTTAIDDWAQSIKHNKQTDIIIQCTWLRESVRYCSTRAS